MTSIAARRSFVLVSGLALACTGTPSSDSGDPTATGDTHDSGESGDSGDSGESGESGETDTETGTDPGEFTGELVLDTVLDINAVVTTKGMDVDDAGRVLLWNYNQDQLEVYDGASLQVLADMGLVTSFGTDLSVDSSGAVVVSKGGDSSGEQLMKWDGETGEALWGPTGLSFAGAVLLGLTHASVEGEEFLFVADGAATGGQIHRLDPSDGALLASTPVTGVPLDLAVGPNGSLYVLRAPSSNPVGNGEAVELLILDDAGGVLAGPLPLVDGVYITRASDGVLYVSSTDFAQPTRRILSFGPELDALSITELPPEYEGFAGGITSVGAGADTRVMISAQGGIGSGEICDVLIYRPTP